MKTVLEDGYGIRTVQELRGHNEVKAPRIYGGVEIPSDYAGVLYVALDDGGAWRFTVAREMKSIGMEIDLNKAV